MLRLNHALAVYFKASPLIKANGQSLPSFGDHKLISNLLEKYKSGELNVTHSKYERHINNDEIQTDFFYHTDIEIDFHKSLWYWNSTHETVEDTDWDNIDYFESDYPYMQDAVAINIYADSLMYRVFVSSLNFFSLWLFVLSI